jgi:hypothetical protein
VVAVGALLVLIALRKNGLLLSLWYADPNRPSDYRAPPFKRLGSNKYKKEKRERDGRNKDVDTLSYLIDIFLGDPKRPIKINSQK